MSLLGGYKKKTSYDGYESLQLVDSSGDFSSGGRGSSIHGSGSIAATLGGPKAAPLREEDCSTMDSSGKSLIAMGGGARCAVRSLLTLVGGNVALLHAKRSAARLSLCPWNISFDYDFVGKR